MSRISNNILDILIYFCKKLRKAGVALKANTVLGNIYLRQIIKIKKAIATLHEDLQFDYNEELKSIL